MSVQERSSRSSGFADWLFGALCSLKLAVIVILGLTASLATATVLESLYDTPTAQYYVYHSMWFHAVLAALGINIFCVAVSRWPWKPRHIPFLLAHLGILLLLGGSWMTERFGLDGSARIAEGEAVNRVELDDNSLIVTDATELHKIPIRWIPPGVAFKPIVLKDRGLRYDVTVDRFLSHADPSFSFIPNPAPHVSGHPPLAAVQLRLQGGPMNITQDFWLWEGDPSFKNVQMGPASFAIGADAVSQASSGEKAQGRSGPSFAVVPQGDGFSYRARSSEGKVVQGRMSGSTTKGQLIQPGWRGNVRLTVLDWVPDAVPLTHYAPARVQYGQQAPPAAIHVISGKGGENAETWLGIGDRAMLHTSSGDVELAYLPQRIGLPFTVRLDRFQIERYQGSIDPSSYSSRVTVFDNRNASGPGRSVLIKMNEPLTLRGVTLYQASYEDGQPRPTVSILSVNHDPGRPWKYFGSALLVSGAILLFAVKYRKPKTSGKNAGKAPASARAVSEVV